MCLEVFFYLYGMYYKAKNTNYLMFMLSLLY